MRCLPSGVHLISAAILCQIAGCVSTRSAGRLDVSTAVAERTGTDLRPEGTADPLPSEGVELDDGLSRTEAVAIALWNNPQLETDLAQLGFARAELVQAGMLRNPLLSLFFPWGPKQLEFTFTWPVQELWLRPRRVETARRNAERIAQGLVENGLDLAESVKVAYAEVVRQRALAALAREIGEAEGGLSRLAEARLRAGDVGELEVELARAQAFRAEEEARRAELQTVASEQRLLAFLDLEPDVLGTGFSLEVEPAPGPPSEPEGELVSAALATRPDVRAAEIAIEWAGERLGLERDSYWRISAIVDANGEGLEGFEIGPGFLAELPVFDRNQGVVSVARAELDRAVRNYAAVRNRIAYEVKDAVAQLAQAQASLDVYRDGVVPELERASERTARAQTAGDVSDIEVLTAKLAHLRGRSREAELAFDVSRWRARLENAVGRNLGESP